MNNKAIERGIEHINNVLHDSETDSDMIFAGDIIDMLEAMKSPECNHSFVCHELFMECEICGERKNYEPTPKESEQDVWVMCDKCGTRHDPRSGCPELSELVTPVEMPSNIRSLTQEEYNRVKPKDPIREVYEKWNTKEATPMPIQFDYIEWFWDMWNAIKQYCEE